MSYDFFYNCISEQMSIFLLIMLIYFFLLAFMLLAVCVLHRTLTTCDTLAVDPTERLRFRNIRRSSQRIEGSRSDEERFPCERQRSEGIHMNTAPISV